MKYLQLTSTKCNGCSPCTCSSDGNYSDNPGKNLTTLDFIGSQTQIDGSLKLIETQKCLQWLVFSYCKLVDDNFIAMLSEVLMHNTYLKVLNLNGCNITSVGANSIAHFLKINKTLECIYLQDNIPTLREKDITMLLQTIHNYKYTIQSLFLDKQFRISHKIIKQLKLINLRRQWKNVNDLNITPMDCFKFPMFCHSFISSFISRLDNNIVSLGYTHIRYVYVQYQRG